ncbi:rsbT co-antagonist protein RsbR [Nannocystis exedens]|uniref:RsbT co-antagonist protein RsbR n=1 Tax=Nannocystis exedens TaxID=54 RepID=A0A1I2EMK8_9BACT|nr:PAS domain-containing protein [Nannocystis exedens]PCC73969.1 anti-anti-sigma factor [Nannocystis exedens]SFE93470.1 rsbT co-antagonist protein RsbR [Nannocystis exedens]
MHTPGEDGETAVAHRVPFALVGFDRELRVSQWNERAERLFGLAAADARGRRVAELLPLAGGDWRDLWTERDDLPAVRLDHADGRTFEWTVAPARQGERVVGVVCYGADVTARAATAREAELEHVMLRVLVDNLPLVVCAYAPDGTYLYVAGQGLAATPMTAEQMIGKNPLELFADDPDTVQFIRRGLEGTPTRMTLESFGRWWDSWHIPAPPGHRAALVSMSLDVTESHARERELRARLELIERQQRVIRELSTPIIEVWDGVLVMPLIGLVDSMRTSEIMDSLLQSVGRLRARFAILDLTGIEVVDTTTANHLIAMIRAVRLLGAEGILTGIHPGIAQTIVTLGVDLRGFIIHATLRQALGHCLATMDGPRPSAGKPS